MEPYHDGEVILAGMAAHRTDGHGRGHHVFHFGSPAATPLATMVGHLAITPLHLATGPCRAQHVDPDHAWAQLRSIAADGRVLLGPLWPSPGAGRWIAERFVAVDDAF